MADAKNPRWWGVKGESSRTLGGHKFFRRWNQAGRTVCSQHFRLVSPANKYDQGQSQPDGEQVEAQQKSSGVRVFVPKLDSLIGLDWGEL